MRRHSSIDVPMIAVWLLSKNHLRITGYRREKDPAQPLAEKNYPTCLSGVTPKCSYHTNTPLCAKHHRGICVYHTHTPTNIGYERSRSPSSAVRPFSRSSCAEGV